MSLQSDFEYCLEYAKLLEENQERQVQAQNNIIFLKNESERLKSKLKVCKVLSAISAIVMFIVTFVIIKFLTDESLQLMPLLIVSVVVFSISLYNGIKTKKESKNFETQKPLLIAKYINEAENCEFAIKGLIEKICQENLFDIVPTDYFSSAAIGFCLTRVRQKLADTASEAFRQLEDEIRYLEHVEYLEQLNDTRIEQLNGIKRAIEINTLVTLAEQSNKK